MNITREEPGRLLALEGEDDAPRLPGGMLGSLVGGFLAFADPSMLWHASGIRADREAGTLEIVETNLSNGEKRSATLALASVLGLNVRNRFWRPPSTTPHPTTAPGADGIDLAFQFDNAASPSSRSIWIRVDGIDAREKVADFAYRLGASLGLSHQRVVQSDPRRIQIDMASRADSATEPMPQITGRADYARRDVMPEARTAASHEIVPAFGPAPFRSEFKVAPWAPGDEVRIERPFDKTAIGCLPTLLGGLLIGPASLAVKASLVSVILTSIIGLLVAFLSGFLIRAFGPKRTVISWRERTLAFKGWLGWRRVPFDELAAIELRCVREHHSSKHRSGNFYACEILAHFKVGSKPLEIANTESFSKDPETPYDNALPLVTELGRALAIERRVTEYT